MEIGAGLGWRWFLDRVLGLSPQSRWREWRASKPAAPLEGDAAERYFAGIGR